MKTNTEENNLAHVPVVFTHKRRTVSTVQGLGRELFFTKSFIPKNKIDYETFAFKRAFKRSKQAFLATLVFLSLNTSSFASSVDLSAIKQIESSGNSQAFNKHSGAIGHFQITEICLQDFNELNKTSYSKQDLFNPQVNKLVASWYLEVRIPQLLRHFKYPVTVQNALIAYNCGIACLKRPALPKETLTYLKKYKELTQ